MRIHIDINFKLKPKHKAIVIITDCTESWYYLSDILEWVKQKYLLSIFNKKRRNKAYEKLFALESVQKQMDAGFEKHKQQKEKEKQWLLKYNL